MNIIRGGSRIQKEECNTKELFDLLYSTFSDRNREAIESHRKTSEFLFQCGTELTGEEQERCFKYADLAAERMDKAATDGQFETLCNVLKGVGLVALGVWGFSRMSNYKRLSN